jgi:tetratricopeptide (TPR) repeat protein
LSRGDLRAAEARFGRLCDFAAAFPTKDPSYGVRSIPDAIEVLIGLGRLDDAAALLGPFAAQADAVQRAWAIAGAARCRGLLAAARGDLDGALAALEASRAGFERLGYPFEQARTLLVIGQAHRRAKQKRAARDALGEALAVFERLGAPHWAERSRAELGVRMGTQGAGPGRDEG